MALPVSKTAPSPAWLRGAVTYGAVPTLFGEEPLRDLTERLDDLQELGVDAVWISPIQETDDLSDISYATTDFQAIRPDFGTPHDLKALVQEAHARDIKVLLDIAPNHVSQGHPAFVDAEKRGDDSPYYDYFDRDANGDPTYYFDWEHLKNLNYDNPGVQKMVTSAFDHWVKEYDVDGFRVDAAWGPRQRKPEFWGHLSQHLREVKPDLFLLAEASARDPYYLRNGFNAAYDWTDKLGVPSWSEVFADTGHIGEKLRDAIGASPKEGVARFLDNNDTGARFITQYGAEKARVAATLLLTLPGLPVVYSGDEVGAEFQPYDDPPPLDWKDQHGLRPHYARLAELREQIPALASGDYTPLPPAGDAFGFSRQVKGEDPVVVALNFGASQQRLHVPKGRWRDLLSGQVLQASEKGLQLPPTSSYVLQPAH
jgi:glycosidase